MVSDYTTLFAAVMPAVPITRSVDAGSVKHTPLYVAIGADDNVVTVESVAPFIKELQAKGGDVKSEVLPNSNHQQAVRDAFSGTSLLRFFSHVCSSK